MCIAKRDLLRFDVDALAKPDIGRPFFEEFGHVLFAASQAGLDHDADVVMAPSEVAVDVECRRGDARVFHVDAQETAVLMRAGGQRFDRLTAARDIEPQTQFRQLDRDTAIQGLRLDLANGLEIQIDRGLHLLVTRAVFAENIDCRRAISFIECANQPIRIVQFGARDVALRQPPHHRLRHVRHRGDDRLVDQSRRHRELPIGSGD